MKTEKLDRIRQLQTAASSVGRFWDMWSEKYMSDSHCDKKDAKFTLASDRFQSFRLNLGFECYAGYYGNSSCSTVPIMPTELAQAYFVRAMNEMRKELFTRVAELMRKDAADLTIEAEAEIAALQAMLKEARAVIADQGPVEQAA